MDNELQQLKDIHLPQAISWWPLAPGWFVLLAVLCGLLIYLFYLFYQKTKQKYVVKYALTKLKRLAKEDPSDRNLAAEISTLIRRTALHYFNRTEIAGLTGQAWLEFLNRSGNTQQFTTAAGYLLIDAPYRKNNPSDLAPLFAIAETWLVTISKKKTLAKGE